jgi:hypothetical protein
MASKKEKLPSQEDLREVPRWARVAFAARCARRVQPLFQAAWPDAPGEYVEAVDRAIRVAEGSAAWARADAHADEGAAGAAGEAAAKGVGPAFAAGSAASAAARASAAAADHFCSADIDHLTPYLAPVSLDAACAAGASASDNAGEAVRGTAAENNTIRAMRMDFEKLRAAAEKERWTDETPVPREFFGPVWPECEPPGWPSTAARPMRQKTAQPASKEERLVVQASVHVPVDDEMLVDGITELYQALNRYHILCGGTGLTIDDWQILVPSGTRVRELV